MNSSSKRLLAVIPAILVVVLIARGLDHLPSNVRTQIAAERTALAAAETNLRTEREQIAAQVKSDPALFDNISFGKQWPDRLDQSAAVLASASRDMEELARLEIGRASCRERV